MDFEHINIYEKLIYTLLYVIEMILSINYHPTRVPQCDI